MPSTPNEKPARFEDFDDGRHFGGTSLNAHKTKVKYEDDNFEPTRKTEGAHFREEDDARHDSTKPAGAADKPEKDRRH